MVSAHTFARRPGSWQCYGLCFRPAHLGEHSGHIHHDCWEFVAVRGTTAVDSGISVRSGFDRHPAANFALLRLNATVRFYDR